MKCDVIYGRVNVNMCITKGGLTVVRLEYNYSCGIGLMCTYNAHLLAKAKERSGGRSCGWDSQSLCMLPCDRDLLLEERLTHCGGLLRILSSRLGCVVEVLAVPWERHRCDAVSTSGRATRSTMVHRTGLQYREICTGV